MLTLNGPITLTPEGRNAIQAEDINVKAVWTLALSVVLLAGCGSSPVATKVSTQGSQAEANGLFFKEADYANKIAVVDIHKLVYDEASNKENAGKKFVVSGDLGYSVGDMQLVDANDVTLTLTEDGHYAYIHRERHILRSAAENFIKKVGGDMKGTSTVYFTLKSGNTNTRVHVDAIKRPDGTLVKL